LGNISNGFFTNTDSAFYFYNEALSLFSLLNDSANISITYTNLGNVSKSVSGPRSGLDYYYKSLAIDEKRKDLYGQSFVLSNLAITYQKMGEYDSALYFSRRLLDVSHRINSLHRQRQAYQRMAYLFRDKKVMDSAFHYLEKYQILKDSLLDQSTKDRIAELQFEFRDKAQAQEIEILQREKEIDQLALEANYQQKLMLIILVIVLALGILLLIARAKERSRLMKELKERQSEVEKAKELIEKKNRQLINLNESLESNVLERTQELNSAYQNLLVTKERLDHFIYKSAHDLKGPISSIRGLVYLIKLELKKIDTGDSFVDYVQKLEHTALEMDTLLMRLTESHTMNHGIVRNEEVDLAEIIDELEFIFKEKLKQLNVEFLVQLSASKSVQSDAIIIQLILKYFLENAIQYVDERRKDSFIEIRTAIEDEIFSIHIIDNGLGIEPALKPDLFKMFSKGKKGKSGLGLFYVGLLAEKISANAYLDDKDTEYTHFVLELPLSN
jgi:signal transduction histidine kinase